MMEKYQVEIMALQETKQKGSSIISVDDYIFYTSGNEHRNLSTGFLISKKMNKNAIYYKAISDRMCLLRKKDKFRKIFGCPCSN